MRNRLIALVVFGLAPVLAAISGCGSDGAGSCGKVQPCGGVVTGTWSITGFCNTAAGMNSLTTCAGAVVNTSGLKIAGTVAFNPDLTYTETISETGTETISQPSTCLAQGGVAATCADLDATFRAEAQSSGGVVQSASCAQQGANCSCQLAVNLQGVTQSGTYAYATGADGGAGTALVLTTATGTATTGQYCVQGNELHLITTTMSINMGSMGQQTIVSDVVARKQ
jgi:hypothetical protein